MYCTIFVCFPSILSSMQGFWVLNSCNFLLSKIKNSLFQVELDGHIVRELGDPAKLHIPRRKNVILKHILDVARKNYPTQYLITAPWHSLHTQTTHWSLIDKDQLSVVSQPHTSYKQIFKIIEVFLIQPLSRCNVNCKTFDSLLLSRFCVVRYYFQFLSLV